MNQRQMFHTPRRIPLGKGLLVASCLSVLGCGPPEARMPRQSQAFSMISEQFAQVLPKDILFEPDVHWWTDKCPGSDRSAVVLGQQCYSGLYYRKDAIDVAWRGDFGESAYAHELMHYFLDQVYGASDPLHLRVAEWASVNRTDVHLHLEGM